MNGFGVTHPGALGPPIESPRVALGRKAPARIRPDSRVESPAAGSNLLRVSGPGGRVDFSRRVHGVLGLPFDAIGIERAVGRVHRAVARGEPCFVSTPNVNFLSQVRGDDAFRQSVLHSDLSLPDGMPIVWWARLLDIPMRERVAGADVFDRMADVPVDRRVRVYFLGGPDGVAERASRAISRRPGVTGVGGESPGFVDVDAMDLDAIAARVDASGADFLLVALGAAKGQAFIERIRHRVRAPVIAHLGAVVNFAAATVRRAPPLFRWIGMEWAWRILQEPALWRRYLGDGSRLLAMLWHEGLPTWRYLRAMRARHAQALATGHQGKVNLQATSHGLRLNLDGPHLDERLPGLRSALAEVARSRVQVEIVCGREAALGTAAMGLLLLLAGYMADGGIGMTLVCEDPRLATILQLNGLDAQASS